MTDEELDITFYKAYQRASNTTMKLAPDIMLHFYAYYKHATQNQAYKPSGENHIRNAFKLNALLQIKDLSINEAKLKYIELVNTYIKD